MTPAVLGSLLGTAAVTAGRGAVAAVGDGLSFIAQLARATGGLSAAEPAAAPAAGAKDAIAEQVESLQARALARLREAGIELSAPVELMADEFGRIRVAGAHPQAAAIETALSSDVLLERDFAQLAAAQRQLAGAAGLAEELRVILEPGSRGLRL